MVKNIGLVWLKDDFRLKNLALAEATKNHSHVVAFYLYKIKKFENQEAQKWWVIKSLKEFKNKLLKMNIKLEIIKIDTYKSFLKIFQIEKIFNLLE